MRKRKVSLVDDWRVVARKAWSVRFMALSGLAQVVDFLGLLSDYVPPEYMRVLVFASVGAAIVSRFVKQGAISGQE